MAVTALPTLESINEALTGVIDPEIRRPITELGMVREVEIADDGVATVHIDLTTAGCPMKGTITSDVKEAVRVVPDVTDVTVELGVMSPEQRVHLKKKLRGGDGEPVIPFSQPGSLTKVFAIASGKGGVGKSSLTANLAVALAEQGLQVGVVDADIYGFSIPKMLGVTAQPTKVDDMLMPPIAFGVKVVSIGMFVPAGQPVVWRGPMLHRALQQFLADVFWGDLDVLLLDLPPGTGDIAISVGQMLPGSQLVVITTPQAAAAEVAERAGSVAKQTSQHVAGVIENMSWLVQPDGSRLELFGSGGGGRVAESLSSVLGIDVPLMGQIPLDMVLRESGDEGMPVVLSHPESSSAQAITAISKQLIAQGRGLAGRKLPISTVD